MKLQTFLLSTLLMVFIVIGCKKDKAEDIAPIPEPTPEQIVVAENTKLVDDATRNSILTIDTNDYTFTFSGNTSLLQGLQTGDIIVDSVSEKAPYGYLRKIKTINALKDGTTTIETEQAKLTEAVTQGSINFRTGKVMMGQVERYVLADGVQLQNLKQTDFTVFSLDYDQVFETENGKITVSGHTELDIDFFFDFDWYFEYLALPPHPVVEKFETGVEINQSASLNVVSENGASLHERIPLAQFYFMPWTFMLGPIPVVFVPRIELFVEMDGSITAVFTASASESFTGRVGSRYTDANGWSEIADKTYQTDFAAPNLDAGASFTSHIGPEIALLLYGVAGPFANVTGCGQVSAYLYTSTGNWDLEFKVGSQAKVGVKVDIIGFDESWSKEFCLFEEVVMQLQNEPFGNHLYLQHPVEGQVHLVGDPLLVQTSYTGETPDEVLFIIDGTAVFTDDTEPFEYNWITDGLSEGIHTVGVSAFLDGAEIGFDGARVDFKIPVWDILTLSDLGLNESTTASDLYFINSAKGWMTIKGLQNGMILQTVDAGLHWELVHQTNKGLEKILPFNDLGEAVILDEFGDVWHTTDGGNSLSLLTYGDFSQPTFQWKNIYDLASNHAGELVAVGKDTGIPYHYRIYRADMAFHDPTGYFEIPYPNEYGAAPKIVMRGNNGLLYNVLNEDEPTKSYYMITTDGGVSWQGSAFGVLDANAMLNDAFIPDNEHLWLVGEENDNAIVVMSDDAGQSWTKVALTGIPAFSSVHFINNTDGFASTGENSADAEAKVFKTTDGGHNWEPMIETNTVYGMTEVFFLGEDFGVVSGKGHQIFRYATQK